MVCGFLLPFLQLLSSCKALWSDDMLGMISSFWHLLRLVLFPNEWPNLEVVPCALEKNGQAGVLGGKAL